MDVTFEDVLAAQVRIAPFVRRTPVLTSRQLDERVGAHVHLKCESFQRVGAFKYRGATNAVQSLAEDVARRGVACHSSGNHGQALALAARDRTIDAYIVMPADASAVKRAAVAGYGARIVDCEPTQQSREATLERVLADTGAVEIHPYDNPRIIAGAGTAALELLQDHPELDVVVAPVGGGGLLSGTALAVSGSRSKAKVWGAEPAADDDAHRSFATGMLEPSSTAVTVADGLLTSLSERTFAIIRAHVAAIPTVSDVAIIDAMRFLWERMKLVVEPSGAVPLAAVFQAAEAGQLPGDQVGVILSGGNVDLDRLPWAAGIQ